LPLPARHLLDMARYRGFVLPVPGRGRRVFTNIVSSRGCPIGCCFCATSAMWGQRFRARSARKVVEEIETVVADHGIQGVWFFDDSFATDRRRVYALCDLLRARRLDVPWLCDARVDSVDEPLLARMKEAGCFSISFGVETGSARILAEVLGKHITLDRVRQVKRWCEHVGIRARWLFMVGLPTETRQEALATLELMAELGGENSLGVLKVYPGTPLERLARERGILPESFTWTRRTGGRIVTMPGEGGDAPLFLDALSWKDTAEILLRYAEGHRGSLRGRALSALGRIRSPGEARRLLAMGLVYARRRVGG
ncbi:MAG: radical SAM protein, partial [Planctomycetes bacterium]|nr:radical SAM protein [Planctomycetota bacterium]